MTMLTNVDEIIELYRRWGDHAYDEEVTQTTHAVQCAHWAMDEDAPSHLVVAALLHDMGHLLEIEARQSADVVATIDLRHQHAGADALAGVFGHDVTNPIRWHVEAKRYLCATDPSYMGGLSVGSLASLALQGGPMTPTECAQFAALNESADAVRLRRWDDRGKDVDSPLFTVDDLARLLRSHCTPRR